MHPESAGSTRRRPGQTELTFLITRSGKPFTPSDFSEQFSRLVLWRGHLPKQCSAHGLRKAACRQTRRGGVPWEGVACPFPGAPSLHEMKRSEKAAVGERGQECRVKAQGGGTDDAASHCLETAERFNKCGALQAFETSFKCHNILVSPVWVIPA